MQLNIIVASAWLGGSSSTKNSVKAFISYLQIAYATTVKFLKGLLSLSPENLLMKLWKK